MKTQKVKILLEKYYKGESTIEDENALMEYFQNNDVNEDLIDDKNLFLGLYDLKNEKVPVPDGLKKDILNRIKPLQKPKTIKLNFIISVAASVIIIISSLFFINHNKNLGTYDNPELAYLETKEALYTVSKYFNMATDAIKPIEKIETSTKSMEYLKLFNEGYNRINK